MEPPKGVLLCGPTGCGKTLLAKAAATEMEVNFISVKGPALLSKYIGESEKGGREIFHKARQASPCILFFDEIDALVPARGGGDSSGVTDRVIGQFLTELDGIEELTGVLILGATNRRDIIDPAVLRPGRFDQIITIPLPDQAGRTDIFALNLRDKPLAPDVSVADLAAKTGGFSGAEIHAACNRAALAAIRNAVPSPRWTTRSGG
nr:AAA family ATPase [Frigoriglobus tundricola]